MRASQRLPILILVWGLAAIIEMRAGEPEKPPAPPKTPGECHRLVLQEITEFRQLKGPVIRGADEHIGRAAIASFHEAQTQARIALAFAGDRDAVAELVKQFDLDQADGEAWARTHSERDHGVYPSWTPTLRLVSAALETSRPELAQKMRQRMIRLWQVEARPTFPNYDAALLDKCTLTELKTIGDSDHPLSHEALRRWARLDPKGATPSLVERINDPQQEVNRRFYAAFALAQIGDRRGVDWLKDACVNNIGLGGRPGAALLESGAAGAAAFFQLVDEHQQRQPDKALPYALAEGAAYFSTETLFKHLPRLLKLKDEKARYQVRSAVGRARLSADQLAFLIDYLRKGNYQDETLCDSLQISLSSNGLADDYARQAAGLWVDELHQSTEQRVWQLGARIHLATRLGTRELAAAGARRHMKQSLPLTAQILAETGRSEDAALLWEATHSAGDKKQGNWYEGPAPGWLSIVRLTSPAAAPK
jgi:PBS lyase HEAT-like repeat